MKEQRTPKSTTLFFIFFFLVLLAQFQVQAQAQQASDSSPPPLQPQPPLPQTTVCIIGSGIGGSSVAHFLRLYATSNPNGNTPNLTIRIFERKGIVGGRMATVNVSGEIFEAGATVLHPNNFHARNFTKFLNLTVKEPSSSSSLSLGIWEGNKFVFKTVSFDSNIPFVKKIVSLANSIRMLVRYGFSLLRMEKFTQSTLEKFLKYYESFESRPIFEKVDDMLKWAGLYNLTAKTLKSELAEAGLTPLLIQELVTVITRINYGQSVSISGLAGAVSLAGSGGGLWSIKGGNWQMAAGLIDQSDVALHLHEEIESITTVGKHYDLSSSIGKSYTCQFVAIATPLDELNIQFDPPISIPKRKLQHTHATFVRGLLNPVYFGMSSVSEIPELVGTMEDPGLPFSSISILKRHSEQDITYKIFSRKPIDDALLDSIFSVRTETIQIDWGAYPHYNAPEVFAPFNLDGKHLYYVNAFENAASTMETSAVAAENVARLILSRFFNHLSLSSSYDPSTTSDINALHMDL